MSSTSVIRRISSETRDLTPSLAAEFANMPASVTERDLEPKRLRYLRDVIQGGMALPFQWARAKVLADGQTYRVNGHHSSSVLAEMNGTMPQGMVAHIDDFEVADTVHLATLFRQFDNRRSARGLGDISGAYQMIVPELRGVPRIAGRRAIEGVAWYEHHIFGGAVPKGDELYELFHDKRYHSFVQFMGEVYSTKTPEFTTPVVAAMFATFDRAPDQAETFWPAVARQGGGNDERHPATVLDAWLLNGRESNERPKAMEVYTACVVAWNAFRNDRQLARIPAYNAKKSAPEVE